MLPSEEFELKIFRFAESAGKARWRPADLSMLFPFIDDALLMDALHDLHAREFVEFRQWDNERKDWLALRWSESPHFYRGFEIRVTFSGRKYFESLEAQAAERSSSTVSVQQLGLVVEGGVSQSQKETPVPQSILALESTNPTAFVSYGRDDQSFVERFASDLRKYGVDAWCAVWEIKAGDSLRAKIDEGLGACDFFIIVLSRTSVGRPWVLAELDAATARKNNGKLRKIIPIKIDDCNNLPSTLTSLRWEDFSNQPYESALKRVLDSIFDVDLRPPLGKRPTAPEVKPTENPGQKVEPAT